MRSSKRKTVVKPPKKNLFRSAPAVVFILGFLLTLFLIDLYRVINEKDKRHDHSHQDNEHINRKNE
jgi:hypothetical protein